MVLPLTHNCKALKLGSSKLTFRVRPQLYLHHVRTYAV